MYPSNYSVRVCLLRLCRIRTAAKFPAKQTEGCLLAGPASLLVSLLKHASRTSTRSITPTTIENAYHMRWAPRETRRRIETADHPVVKWRPRIHVQGQRTKTGATLSDRHGSPHDDTVLH